MPYVRLTGIRLKFWDANGLLANGYTVWQVAAGTTATTVTTYGAPLPNGSLGAANANPIVLPANAECDIITLVPVKICFCLPTSVSPTDGVIETVDWLADFQGLPPLSATVTPGTTHNNYVATTTPSLAALTENQMIIMKPDVDSVATIGTQVFAGSGINDLIFSGPYDGLVSGAIFRVEILALFIQPPSAPTVAVSATLGVAGPPTAGTHYVLVTFVTADGETTAGTASLVVTADGTHKIDVTNIPVGATGLGVLSRNIYMTKAAVANTGPYFLAASIADNTTTALSGATGLDVADAALPATEPPVTNGTGDGIGADQIQWNIDGGAFTPASITGSKQLMANNVSFDFAQNTGHYLSDAWTVPVERPVRLNVDGLGNWLVYKISGGALEALGAGDLKADTPAEFLASPAQSLWFLVNPSLPVLTALTPSRVRKEIYGNYTVLSGDASNEISCNADCTIDFPALSTLPNDFFYIHPGPYTVTVRTVGFATDLIIPPYTATGATSYQLYIGGPGTVQFANNGASLHILTQVAPWKDFTKTTIFTIPHAPSGAASAAAGTVKVGNHKVKISFVIGNSYTGPGTESGTIVAADSLHGIDLTGIPVGPIGTTARKVWMTKAAGATYYLVATIANNTATTYTITGPDDAILGTGIYVAAPAAGLWTKTPGYNWADVEVMGSGGAGSDLGGGGGAGGRCLKTIDIAAITSETVTVAASVSWTGGGDGPDGNTSSFGSLCSATGGGGGKQAGPGGLGGIGVGGDINISGESGNFGFVADVGNTAYGMGGNTPYGAGGAGGSGADTGGPGLGYGAGGGGGNGNNNASAPGIVIVKEYH